MSASGKIANSMVFFPWKGLAVVREWLKPANPQSTKQGDRRIILGGTGRACGEILPGKNFAQQLITLNLIPSGQTKQSYMVQYIMDHYLLGSTTYAAELALLTAHTAYGDFGTGADLLGIVEYDLAYATIAPYNKALGLYLIAKTAIALGLAGAPYTTALTAWTTTQTTLMLADFTAV